MRCAIYVDPSTLTIRQLKRRGRGFIRMTLHRDQMLVATVRRIRPPGIVSALDAMALPKIKKRILDLLTAAGESGILEADLREMLESRWHHRAITLAIRNLAKSKQIIHLANLRIGGQLQPAKLFIVIPATFFE